MAERTSSTVWDANLYLKFADARMRLEAPVLDRRIVIVDIDPKSLAEVGRFPWSRNVMAQLVDQLVGRYKAAAVGFDVSFPEPDTSSGYAVLERLAQQFPKAVMMLLSSDRSPDTLIAAMRAGVREVLPLPVMPCSRKQP